MASMLRSSLVRRAPRRGFSSTSSIKKDYVQELYLNSVKAYQAPPKAKDAHVGVVKEFSPPSAPKVPDAFSSSDLARELERYDKEGVSMIERTASSGDEGSSHQKEGMSKDDYIALLEQPEKDGIHYGMDGVYGYEKQHGAAHGGGH